MVWLDPSFHGLLNVKVEDPDIEYVPSRIVFEESLKHITVLRLFSVSVIPEADTTTWALSPTFVDGLAETELGTDGGWFVQPDETHCPTKLHVFPPPQDVDVQTHAPELHVGVSPEHEGVQDVGGLISIIAETEVLKIVPALATTYI